MSLESNKTLGGVGAILLAIPVLNLIGIILVLIALKGMTDYYNDEKILKNALSSWIARIGLSPDVLEKAAGSASIDLQRRPETLSIEDFVRLSDAIQTLGFPIR